MIEEQLPQELEPIQEIEISKPNWKLWIAAGGCVVLLCAAVFVGTLIFAGPKFVQQFIPEKVQVADELLRETTQINGMGDPAAPPRQSDAVFHRPGAQLGRHSQAADPGQPHVKLVYG